MLKNIGLFAHAVVHQVVILTSSFHVNDTAFTRMPLSSRTCCLLTCSPLECSKQGVWFFFFLFQPSTTQPICCCTCLNIFGMCRNHQIQNEYIVTKKKIISLNIKYLAFVLSSVEYRFAFYFYLHINFFGFRVVMFFCKEVV